MIANTISRIIARVSRQSSTGNATARPDRCLTPHSRLYAASKYNASAAHAKSVTQSGTRNRMILAPRRLQPTPRTAIKSP